MSIIVLPIFCTSCGKQQSKVNGTPNPKFCGFCGTILVNKGE